MAEFNYNTLVQASQLLFDQTQIFNEQKATALDLVTSGMRSNNIQIIQACNKIWVDLQNDNNFWTITDQVLLYSKNNQTKFLALKVLEEQIKSKWKLISEESRQLLKGFILKQLLHYGAKDSHDQIEESLLNQINMIIVQILKHEWKTTWISFIPEICELSKTDQNLCENNLKLLKLLSQEIFDYSKNQMTTQQIVDLKSNLFKEFQLIFELCFFLIQTFVERQNIKVSLIKQTLETLYTYLSWIPFGFIFMTQLCEILIQLFDNNHFRNLSIRCLTEIVILKLETDQQKAIIQQQKIGIIFEKILIKLKQVFPCDFGFLLERQRLKQTSNTQLQHFDDFCAILTQFFTGLLNQHLDWLEVASKQNHNVILLVDYSLQYLVGFSQLPLEQNYKVCAEFWYDFTKKILEQPSKLPEGNQIILNLYNTEQTPPSLQNSSYPRILVEVRKIVVSKMAKPQEVLISIDETGQPVKEELQNTENNALYDLLKDLLINLAKLNWTCTKEIITSKLDNQMNGSEWSFDNLNSICWAIGSISGCLPESDEKQFLIHTIKNLLSLCEIKKGKENKAVVAANIMYVVGQYPKFLRTNWNFLKTVIKKLFEFMRETFPGVQEMACNTFLTISQKCGKEFVVRQQTNSDQLEREPYINELIRNVKEQITILQEQYKLVYYESLSHMIKFEDDMNMRIQLVNNLVKHLNDQLINYVSANNYLELFKDEKAQQFFVQYFRTLQQIVQPVGYAFTQSLTQFLSTYNQLYLFYSQSVQNQVLAQGKVVLGWYTIKKQRAVKKEIMKLYAAYFQYNDVQLLNQNPSLKVQIIHPICSLLEEYSQSINEQKEPELLLTFKYMLEKFHTPIEDLVPLILKSLFEATIGLISEDFNSYPDHRVNFFEFLRSCVQYHLGALFSLPQEQFKLMIDCIVWAFKHQVPNLQELGLDVLNYIIQNVNQNVVVANQFYSIYFLRLLKDILEILTDNLHASGFKLQSQILMTLFSIATNQQITSKFAVDQVGTNFEYITSYLVNSLSNAFPNVSRQQTEQHIIKMFQNLNNPHNYRRELSDYLINLKQFQENNEHLKQTENQQPNVIPQQ